MSPKELRRSDRIKIKNNTAKKVQVYKKYFSQFMVIKPTQTTCKNCCSLINPRGCYFNNNTNTFVFLCLTCNIKLLCHLEDYLEKYLDENVSPRENDHIMEVLLPEIA